jgi:hypothetical protein
MARAHDFNRALTRTIEPTGGPGVELATLEDAARFVGLLRTSEGKEGDKSEKEDEMTTKIPQFALKGLEDIEVTSDNSFVYIAVKGLGGFMLSKECAEVLAMHIHDTIREHDVRTYPEPTNDDPPFRRITAISPLPARGAARCLAIASPRAL